MQSSWQDLHGVSTPWVVGLDGGWDMGGAAKSHFLILRPLYPTFNHFSEIQTLTHLCGTVSLFFLF